MIERASMIPEGLRQLGAYRALNVDISRTGPFRDISMAAESIAMKVSSPNSPLSQVVSKLPPLDKIVPEIMKSPLDAGKNLASVFHRRQSGANDPDMGIVLPPVDTSWNQEELSGEKKADEPVTPQTTPTEGSRGGSREGREGSRIPVDAESSFVSKSAPIEEAASVPPVIVTPKYQETTSDTQRKEKKPKYQESPETTSDTQRKEKKPRELSATAKAKKVPSTRIGRVASFGSLAAGLGLGALSEASKRTFGFGSKPSATTGGTADYSAFLSEANLNRIVDTLCKVRGAALKLGQIISIQDESIVSPQIAAAFERVRQSADFMPLYQMNRAMKAQFGPDWKNRFVSFNEKPFAAASIGQVHEATIRLPTAGTVSQATSEKATSDSDLNQELIDVAVKIQYPGVAEGMDSDIKNLVTIMKFWKVIPDGMFLDQVIKVIIF